MKRYAKAVPGKGIVASRILQSDNMYDRYRKGQAMLSDPDYKYLQAKLKDEVEAYLSDNDYDWSGEDGKAIIPDVRFRPSRELKNEAAERGYRLVKNRSKYVPDYEYYIEPVDFGSLLTKLNY